MFVAAARQADGLFAAARYAGLPVAPVVRPAGFVGAGQGCWPAGCFVVVADCLVPVVRPVAAPVAGWSWPGSAVAATVVLAGTARLPAGTGQAASVHWPGCSGQRHRWRWQNAGWPADSRRRGRRQCPATLAHQVASAPAADWRGLAAVRLAALAAAPPVVAAVATGVSAPRQAASLCVPVVPIATALAAGASSPDPACRCRSHQTCLLLAGTAGQPAGYAGSCSWRGGKMP